MLENERECISEDLINKIKVLLKFDTLISQDKLISKHIPGVINKVIVKK